VRGFDRCTLKPATTPGSWDVSTLRSADADSTTGTARSADEATPRMVDVERACCGVGCRARDAGDMRFWLQNYASTVE
jgi:hypothetical protein